MENYSETNKKLVSEMQECRKEAKAIARYLKCNTNKSTGAIINFCKFYLGKFGKNDETLKELYPKVDMLESKFKGIEQKLVEKNSKLISSVVMRYSTNGKFQDYWQDGAKGLLEAADKFDLKRKISFSTYAFYWIRQSIQRAETYDDTVRKPAHIKDLIRKLNKRLQNREEGSINNIGPKGIQKYLKVGRQIAENINAGLMTSEIVSLNKIIGEEGNELQDFIGEMDRSLDWRYHALRKCLSQLDERDLKIISCRYSGYTLSETAAELYGIKAAPTKLTRERIRQLQDKAIKKLKKLYNNYNESKSVSKMQVA